MPSIKQIIAEIQLADDLPPSHKVKVVQIIRDAEERLKLKAPKQAKRITNAKNLMSLEAWEADNARLCAALYEDWIDRNKLCKVMISQMIGEFRGEMLMRGKQYANFRMAFVTYLTKGYLSKSFKDCLLVNSTFAQKTVIHSKGVDL